jgi:hypothetical protein
LLWTSRAIPVVAAVVALISARVATAQNPVPLGDDVTAVALPAGIAESDVDITGQWAHIWEGDDGTQIVEIVGEFRMNIGPRRFGSRDGVVWITPRQHDGRHYLDLQVFLWLDAYIIDAGGTTTRGSTLFATTATFGRLRVSADRKSLTADADSQLFTDGSAVRTAYRDGTLPEAGSLPDPLTAIQLSRSSTPQMTFSPGPNAEVINGEWVATMTSGLYFSRGSAGDAQFMEGQADAAVLFADAGDTGSADGADFDIQRFTGIYLEGDVLLTQGTQLVRAERLYFDLKNARALILDPVMRLIVQGRSAPMYIRASEARQLSELEMSASDVKLSPSEFYTPHIHVGAESLYVAFDEDVSEAAGLGGARSGRFSLKHATLNVSDMPVMYFPQSAGQLGQGEFPLQGLRISNSDDFGFTLSTRWQLYNTLGLETPDHVKDATFTLDYFGDRGLGLEVDTEYEDDLYSGRFLGYVIHDSGDEDDLGGFRDETIRHNTRGRVLWQHRHFLPKDWEASFQIYYLSDKNFLEQYYEDEFEDDEPSETYLALKKQRDNHALQLLLQARVNNWMTQSEALPEVSFRLIGQPLGPLTLFSENRAGLVRYEADTRRIFTSSDNAIDNRVNSGTVLRADTRQEITAPFQLGPFKLVPFATGRATWWDDTPQEGGSGRAMGLAGIRGSMYFWRIYEDAKSELFDINGIRHLIKLDFTGWAAGSSQDSDTLFPFNTDVEEIDGFSGGTVGLRQRWQTHRGSGERTRQVDFLTIDLEAGLFSDAQGDEQTNGFVSHTRPEESTTSNYIAGRLNWRTSDTTYLLADANFDLDEGDLDIANMAVAVERTPRLSYFLGWRLIGETDSNLVGVGANYRASDKHAFALRHYTDIDRGSTELLDFTYVRRFPRWYMAFTFALDEIEENTSVSMSIWPEGFENIALGGKRYTGLATSTAIQLDE